MAGKIRGITIELSGDTKGLVKSLNDAKKAVSGVQKQLKDVDKVLKFNPRNTELLTQKQNLLRERVTETKKALESQKKAFEDLKKEGDSKEAIEAQNALQREIIETENKLKSAEDELRNFGSVGAQQIASVGESMKGIGSSVASIGDTLTKNVTLPIIGMYTASTKTFIDWETAFTGVMKTVDETATTTYEDIAEGIKGIARETASSKNEIAGVAEIAGQLGVSADNVVEFTRVMVELGDTTNLTAEEAATALARVVNITGDGTETVEQLGSVIVALGNNYATTESEIVMMANRLAASGTLAGLTSQEIFGLSAAMSSVGISAEAGGTAMTQTLTAIESEVANFQSGVDSNLETIASIAGMSAEAFASAWENEPITAIQGFISGLGELDEKGESATLILDELGMSGVRQSNMLKSLALASEEMASAINTANTAYEENTALSTEAELRYGTTASKISQLKERFTEVGISIGELLLPYLEKGIAFLESITTAWSGLDPEMQSTIVNIGLVVAAIGPILSAGGRLLIGIGQILTFAPVIMSAISTIGAVITGTLIPAIGSVLVAIGPIVIAIGAAIAIGVLLAKHWDEISAKAIEIWGALKEWFAETLEAIKEKFSEIWENIKTTISGVIESIRSTITSVWEGIKTTVTSIIEGIRTTVSNVWNGIKSTISGVVEGIKSTVSSVFESVKNTVSNVFDSIRSTAESVWEGIKNAITNPIETAKGLVESAINFIKGLFPLSIGKIFSNLQLPHISVSGGQAPFGIGGKGSLPSFSIDWYAKAAEAGAIFNQEALFGFANGKFLGAGDASQPELLVGTNTLSNMISSAVARGMSSDMIYDAILRGTSNARVAVYIDGKEVTGIVNRYNTSNQLNRLRTQGI